MSSAESARVAESGAVSRPAVREAARPASLTVTCHSLHGYRRSGLARPAGRASVRCDSTCPAPETVNAQVTRFAYAASVARVVVDVMLKPEIHDPQGEAIASACHRLGFGQVTAVRQGKRFEIELAGDGPVDEAAAQRVAELAAELLANPVIEEFSIQPS